MNATAKLVCHAGKEALIIILPSTPAEQASSPVVISLMILGAQQLQSVADWILIQVKDIIPLLALLVCMLLSIRTSMENNV